MRTSSLGLDRRQRDLFDRVFESVFEQLPAEVRDLLDRVPVCLDDAADPALLAELGCQEPGELFGLYTGVPLTERSHELSGEPSELIHLFRHSLLAAATDAHGRLDERELAEQIRITLMHELGHHYGLDDDRLDQLGFG